MGSISNAASRRQKRFQNLFMRRWFRAVNNESFGYARQQVADTCVHLGRRVLTVGQPQEGNGQMLAGCLVQDIRQNMFLPAIGLAHLPFDTVAPDGSLEMTLRDGDKHLHGFLALICGNRHENRAYGKRHLRFVAAGEQGVCQSFAAKTFRFVKCRHMLLFHGSLLCSVKEKGCCGSTLVYIIQASPVLFLDEIIQCCRDGRILRCRSFQVQTQSCVFYSFGCSRPERAYGHVFLSKIGEVLQQRLYT